MIYTTIKAWKKAKLNENSQSYNSQNELDELAELLNSSFPNSGVEFISRFDDILIIKDSKINLTVNIQDILDQYNIDHDSNFTIEYSDYEHGDGSSTPYTYIKNDI